MLEGLKLLGWGWMEMPVGILSKSEFLKKRVFILSKEFDKQMCYTHEIHDYEVMLAVMKWTFVSLNTNTVLWLFHISCETGLTVFTPQHCLVLKEGSIFRFKSVPWLLSVKCFYTVNKALHFLSWWFILYIITEFNVTLASNDSFWLKLTIYLFHYLFCVSVVLPTPSPKGLMKTPILKFIFE